ncbi:GNAT family N-acetyltransferase [Pseudomonas aeruginosa]|uniref:GNAT family N-acetyltransferase n=1 Tax=Pseudomonas aeruginosa TaxID=287 RepID=UPI0029361FE1|nr:GNAT family N-acetyltransferase [Pseudomonas aeruginosa]MDV2657681.1 GNAT family N-acetyltransferase [Pseudomonas aeruginosa]
MNIVNDMKVQIRPFESADLEKLSEIWFSASSRVHAFLGEQRLREQRVIVEDAYLPKSETWVAHHDHIPVGFIGLINTFIGGLFIDPAMQGNGVGRALITHALKLKGELQLDVYADNRSAHSFYQRLGFEEVARQAEDDNGLPFEIVRMRFRAVGHSKNEPDV